MSRIAKKPIVIEEKIDVNYSSGVLTVKGPMGEMKREFKPNIDIKIEGKEIILTPKTHSLDNLALWGTYASHIRNMLLGVSKGFEKKLVVEGIGFKSDVKGNDLHLSVGFSHPVKVSIPEGVKVVVEKSLITISGIDKEKIGQFSANVRAFKKPEPYKGKGIRYEDEVIKRKQGKKSV